jgi:hypothetical protein
MAKAGIPVFLEKSHPSDISSLLKSGKIENPSRTNQRFTFIPLSQVNKCFII